MEFHEFRNQVFLTSGWHEEGDIDGGDSFQSGDLGGKDGDVVSDLGSASHFSTPKPIPISKLLAPSFLSMFDDPLPSFTIWDYCVAELKSNGRCPARSIHDLLCSFKPLLAPEVLGRINNTLQSLKDSNLGVETALLRSKESILESILQDLKNLAYGPGNTYDDSSGWTEMQSRKGKRQCGTSRPSRGRGKDIPRRSSRQHGQGHGDDDGDDNQDLRSQRESAKAQFFKNVLKIYIDLCLYTTPKWDPETKFLRKRSIAERARLFSEHTEVVTGHSYDPCYNVDGVFLFYHATRLSEIAGFSELGVQPDNKNTEFCSAPAFYIANDVCTAFEFALHNHIVNDPDDQVAVFCFEVDVRILHGDVPSPSCDMFKVKCFEQGVDDDKWRKFCEYNLYGKRPKHRHNFDIVIGSMCFPKIQDRTVTPRSADVVQVAFCTEASWDWISSCVKKLYIEHRGNKTFDEVY